MFGLELWIIVGIVAVLLKTSYQSMQKKLVSSFNSVHLAQSATLVSSLIFGMIVLYLSPAPPNVNEILLSSFSGLLLGGALWAFNKSMETTDLSVASPLQQTIPVFVIVIEPLILSNLDYTLQAALAALVTTVGAYIVVIEPNSPLKPLKEITNSGPLLAVLAAILLALNSIVSHSITQSLSVWNFLLISTFCGFLILTLLRRNLPSIEVGNLSYGLVYTGNLAFSILTLSLVVASTATVFFRLSLVLNVLVGFFVFNEENIMIRLIGSVVIILGVVLTIV